MRLAVQDDDLPDDDLVAAMARLGQRLVGQATGAVVLSVRSDRTVVRFADLVLKAHAADTDPAELGARLRLVADPRLADVWLAPVRLPGGEFVVELGGRQVTAWPAGRALGPADSDDVPWETAAAMLARLHAEPVAPGTPVSGVGRRLSAVVARLATLPRDTDVEAVLEAHAALPGVALSGVALPDVVAAGPRAFVHGDWHLGQVVEVADLGWRFVDADDVGVGDPVWDLARPAAWFAAGLLPLADWARFVDSYRRAGGPALPPDGDPWPRVDAAARAVTVQYAATALLGRAETGADLDEAAEMVVECCRRMTRSRHSLAYVLGTLPASTEVHESTGRSE